MHTTMQKGTNYEKSYQIKFLLCFLKKNFINLKTLILKNIFSTKTLLNFKRIMGNFKNIFS